MIVRYLDTFGITVVPDEAHSPLIIDPDTVLAPAIAFQCFETVGRRYPQIIQSSGIAEHTQLASGDFLDVSGQTLRYLAKPYPFGFPVLEPRNHQANITRAVV